MMTRMQWTRAACTAGLAAAVLTEGMVPTLPARADERDAAVESGRRVRRTPVVEAVEKAAPSVVSVGTTKVVARRYFDWASFGERMSQQELKGLGSGVIVHPSGLVVTNAHVINQADQVVVRLTGLDPKTEDEIPATVLATDLVHDLALLRMDRKGDYPSATFGRSDDLMCGETVIAIGSPVGLGRTVSTGILSALERSVTIGEQRFEGLLQTDAAVNQGNSGGALLNILGEWIGVNSAIASMSGGSDGISFAIPIATVEDFISRSVQRGRVTGRWAGLDFADDGHGAVRVETLYPVGPALQAGVRRGMRVTAVDGHPVRDAMAATLALVDAARRKQVTLDVAGAEGPAQSIDVPLEAPPTETLSWSRLGLRALEVTPEVQGRTGFSIGSGLVVSDVRDGSAAARVGLQAGDLLVSLGTQTLGGADDLLEVLEWTEKETPLAVTLVRPVRTRFGVTAERWKAKVVLD